MGVRILIAEDEHYIVESLRFLLSHAGYDVASVSDGASVLPAIRARHPDLLILDIMLPSMNGFDLLRRIRGTPETGALPVLVLTAKGQEADRRRMAELGADDYVTKPFANSDLVERVTRLLQRDTAHGAGGAAPQHA
jgi:DNA-binding response OmpR family regulator